MSARGLEPGPCLPPVVYRIHRSSDALTRDSDHLGLRSRRAPSRARWGFEATEPHIFSYYDQNIAKHLADGGFENVAEETNDPYNHGWFGVKPMPDFDI